MFVFVCLERNVTKKILRFYFGADSLERAFDNLILSKAFNFYADTLETAERLCDVIGEKMKLERLWAYLDGIISTFSETERGVLASYSTRLRPPINGEERREVNRTVIKFVRRAKRLGEFEDNISVMKKYFCLIASKG